MNRSEKIGSFKSYRRRLPRKRLITKAKLKECEYAQRDKTKDQMEILLSQLGDLVREYGNLVYTMGEELDQHNIQRRPLNYEDDVNKQYPNLIGLRNILVHDASISPCAIEIQETTTRIGYKTENLKEKYSRSESEFHKYFNKSQDIVKVSELVSVDPNPVRYANEAISELE